MTHRPLTAPVDYIVLEGQRSPGVARIMGASTPREAEQRRGYGHSFAWVFFKGLKLAEFTVRLELSSTSDWDDWHDWKHLVARPQPSATTNPATLFRGRLRVPPMRIEHPILADLEIDQAICTDRAQETQANDGGIWTIDIKFLEYRSRPRIALERPHDEERPLRPNEIAIRRNRDEITRLEAELESAEGLAP